MTSFKLHGYAWRASKTEISYKFGCNYGNSRLSWWLPSCVKWTSSRNQLIIKQPSVFFLFCFRACFFIQCKLYQEILWIKIDNFGLLLLTIRFVPGAFTAVQQCWKMAPSLNIVAVLLAGSIAFLLEMTPPESHKTAWHFQTRVCFVCFSRFFGDLCSPSGTRWWVSERSRRQWHFTAYNRFSPSSE